MFLSNKTISKYIHQGKIIVKGDLRIESKGITMHLGDEILIPQPNQTFDTKKETGLKYDKHNLEEKPYTLKPNEFILASTKQIVKTDKDIITMIDGRSTFARAGLIIHLTAMVLDGLPFNEERSVLEIKNLGNFDIVLHQNEPIGTYLFAKLSEKIVGEKISRYSDQKTILPPKV